MGDYVFSFHLFLTIYLIKIAKNFETAKIVKKQKRNHGVYNYSGTKNDFSAIPFLHHAEYHTFKIFLSPDFGYFESKKRQVGLM